MKYLDLNNILRLFLIYWNFKRIINDFYDYKKLKNLIFKLYHFGIASFCI